MKLLKTYNITWASRQLHSNKPRLGEKYLTQLLWKLNKWDILKWFVDSSIQNMFTKRIYVLTSCWVYAEGQTQTVLLPSGEWEDHYYSKKHTEVVLCGPFLGRTYPHWFPRGTEYGRLPITGWWIRGSACEVKCFWYRKPEFTQILFTPVYHEDTCELIKEK